MPFELFLSLFPLALTFPAWRSQQRLTPPLSKIRLALFRCGLVMSIICSFMVFSSWFNPFPLLSDGHGGYSNIRNSMLFDADLFAALLTVGLAIFGRGRSRLFLAASGFVLAFTAFAALLSNGV
jgi:hypothetical protein